MKMKKEEFLYILNKWKSNTGVFSPFFKTNQIVSLSYMENLEKKDIENTNDLKKSIEQVVLGYDLTKTLIIVDHTNHLLASYILNNHLDVKPIFLMNNFIFHDKCLINNKDYANQLFSISHAINMIEKPKGYAFIVDYNRYSNDRDNVKDYFLNEYEISIMDMPNYQFLKKQTSIKHILFITDKKEIKEDVDNILHYYEKYFNVKRNFII